ncbi:Anoctamin,Anoctamin, dimerisation domain [Cinara cedri]|uniref:Anoctamin n=1 Tax=Cinara cedri TaxID=506608 RepID=A0A5E4N577_9HEMI|nr:Anoctamin,Anoctamin, dimerisation domain [Cinara cedri]
MAAFLRPKSREMPDLQRFGPLGRQTPPPSPPPPASPPSSVLQQHQSDDKSSPTAPENWMSSNQRDDFTADNSSPPPPPPPPLAEPDEPQNYTSPKNDGKHVCFNSTVDFVLAYNRSQQNVKSGKEDRQLLDDETERQFFYRELKAHGILVNIDDEPTYSLDAGRTCFALLQLSRRYLCRCRCHTISDEDEQTVIANTKYINYQQCPNDSGNRHSKHDETLTSAQRVQMVWNIIIRIKYGGDKRDENVMDLNRLLEAGIFTAAYPVHDGNFKLNKGDDPDNTILNDRQVLYEYWARPGLIIPRQWKSDERITKLIRQYYGLPVAVYFRWLRYYTVWLIGPAIAGLVWFLYGFISTRQDSPTQDICDPKSPVANWILCPTSRCDAGHCIFTRVLDTCGLYRWTSAATFDRPGAVVFAIFMSFWATAFQQLWTTYSWQFEEYRRADETGGGVRLADCPSNATKAPTPAAAGPPPLPSAEQDRRDASAEKPRQPTVRPTTSVRSPAYITWGDIHRWYSEKLSVSFRAIVFLATLVGVATVPILIVVYRGRVIGWLMTVVFHQSGPNQPSVQRPHRRHNFFLLNYAYTGDLNNWKAAVAAAFAAFVQLTAIVAVHRGYSGVAKWLTQYSYRSVYDPRFQSRYTAFMSCFDSANYYSSLIYIAFFKGRFVTNGRGLRTDGASKIWNFWPITLFRTVWLHIRDDVCQPAAAGTGCVPELCIQLAIIMVGKQIVDNVIELMTPLASNVWRRWRAKENRRRDKLHGKLPDTNVETLRHPKQWQLDYQLEDTGPLGLYQEYSEMGMNGYCFSDISYVHFLCGDGQVRSNMHNNYSHRIIQQYCILP